MGPLRSDTRDRQGGADRIEPKAQSAPTHRGQRVQQDHAAHQQRRVRACILGRRIRDAKPLQLLQPPAQGGIADIATHPLRDRGTPQHMDTGIGLHRQRISKHAGIGDRHRPDLDRSLRASGRTSRDLSPARAGGVQQQRRQRTMIRILRQHAENQVPHGRRQARGADQRRGTAHLQLAKRRHRLIGPEVRHVSRRQGQQQHAQRIDIVGNRPLPPTFGRAHRAIGGFEQRRLIHGRRRCPGCPQHDSLSGTGQKHIVRANAPMGQTALVQLLQHPRYRLQHLLDQRLLGPGMQSRGNRRPCRSRADHKIAGIAVNCGADSVRQRT